MAPWVTPLPRVSSTDGDLVGLDDPLEHGPPRRIGERAHDGVEGGCLHHANTLV